MRGRDEETGEYLSPSRSQKRREALAVFDLGEQLVALSEAQLSKVPMPDALRELVRESRRITSPGARKRQLQFLAKYMRREDEDVLEAIRRALHHDKADARRETAELHRLEALRERLLEDGDAALAELIGQYPHADRQHLRQLVRNAREERLKNRPLHAYRELFRELKQLLRGQSQAAGAGDDAIDDASFDGQDGFEETDLHDSGDLLPDGDDDAR